MAANDDRWQQRLEARLTTAFELHAKLHDVMLDIKRQLAGANPVRDVMLFWDERWMKATRSATHYAFNRTSDPGNIKRLLNLKIEDPLADLQGRIARFLGDPDKWLRQQGYPFDVFIKRYNSYGPKTPTAGRAFGLADDEPLPGPSDCRHAPTCATDMECTTLRRHGAAGR